MAIALASALINLLYLTSSFFMLQIYDRIPHSRMLARISGTFDEELGKPVFRAMVSAPVKAPGSREQQPMASH